VFFSIGCALSRVPHCDASAPKFVLLWAEQASHRHGAPSIGRSRSPVWSSVHHVFPPGHGASLPARIPLLACSEHCRHVCPAWPALSFLSQALVTSSSNAQKSHLKLLLLVARRIPLQGPNTTASNVHIK